MDEFHRSGVSVATFAAKIGVSAPTIYSWKRRLELRQDSDLSGAPLPPSMVRVIATGAPAARVDAGISIISSCGLSCRVERDFDEETLYRVLQLLAN
jgi:transposase-like protein